MNLYCTKHKKQLSERYDSLNKEIETYCVYCKIENKYESQHNLSKEARKDIIKKLTYRGWMLIGGCVLVVLFTPIPLPLKLVVLLFLVIFVFKKIIDPLLTQPPSLKPDWEDIRAKELNQSSIQANQVDNVKRQWKKGFLQEQKGRSWTEEEWDLYLQQYYKKK
ncbi:hypothetical protein [Sutcliffiella deserti]|uniref:hypothetical protein n=1 Tax=Sutcliffiella deserti TaxID=2875501 RepID=UPI001CBE564D|nr:hypothetical protein [Sutcliffiella deserti]